jgi:hypothetical protein
LGQIATLNLVQRILQTKNICELTSIELLLQGI